MSEETKKCPYCGEEILKEAKKCKHCGEWLEKKQEKDNILSQNTKEVSDSGWSIVLKLGLAILGAIVCINLFPHLFDDKIVLTNELNGTKIEIPVETNTLKNGEKEYCVKVSILDSDEHCFCSKDSDSLTKFIKTVKTREMQTRAEMQLKGQEINIDLTKFYSLDKMIYELPKQKYTIYEHDLNEKRQELKESDKIAIAVDIYQKEQTRELAKKFGVSKKCAGNYIKILQYEGAVEGNLNECTTKENQSIKNYFDKVSSETHYADDVSEPLYGNAGMPKSLVLQDVSILCYEKANLGDNSKCSKTELDKIKKFFNENKNINWEKEYFEY